nr:hypothetical protein PanWU01x14_245100 [Ipomoea batatas]
MSMGTISLLPSTPQNDCMKLNKFSPTFIANRSIFFSAATSRDGSVASSSTDTPIFADSGVASAVSWSSPPGSGHGRESTAEGRLSVTAPQKRNGDPGDWIVHVEEPMRGVDLSEGGDVHWEAPVRENYSEHFLLFFDSPPKFFQLDLSPAKKLCPNQASAPNAQLATAMANAAPTGTTTALVEATNSSTVVFSLPPPSSLSL